MHLHGPSRLLAGCLNGTCLLGPTRIGRVEGTRSYTLLAINRPDPRPLLILRACHSSVAFAHPSSSKAARYISSNSSRQFDDLNNDTLVSLVSLHHFEAAQRLHDHLVASGITIQPHPIYIGAALAALDHPSHTDRINLFSAWFKLIPDAHVALPSFASYLRDDASTSSTAPKEASHTSQVVDLRPIHNALLHTGTPANNLPLIARFAALAAEKGYTLPQLASATGTSAQVAHTRIWPDILALLASHAPPALASRIMVEHEFAVGAYVARMGNAHAPAERSRLREQSVRACLDAARFRGDAARMRSGEARSRGGDATGKGVDWSTADAGWLDAAAALLRTADGLKLDKRLFDTVITAHASRDPFSNGSTEASTTTLTALRTARAAHGRKERRETRLALPGDLPMQLREVLAAIRERVLHTYLDVNDFLVRLYWERSSTSPNRRSGSQNLSPVSLNPSPISRNPSSSFVRFSRLLSLLRQRALAYPDATAMTWLVAELYLCRHVMDGRRALGIFLENFTMEGFPEDARELIEEVAKVHGVWERSKGEVVDSAKQIIEGRKRELPPPFIPGASSPSTGFSTLVTSPRTSTAAASPTAAAVPTPLALPPHHHWLIWHTLTLLAWKHPPRLRRLLAAYEASVVGSGDGPHPLPQAKNNARVLNPEALAASGARQVLLGFMSGFARHGMSVPTRDIPGPRRGQRQGDTTGPTTFLADLRRVWRLMERMQITPRRAHYEILAKSVALAGEGGVVPGATDHVTNGAPSADLEPPLSVGVPAALHILEHTPHPVSYASVIDALLDRDMVGAAWKVREAMEGRFGKDALGGRSSRLQATMARLERMTEEKVASFTAQRKRHGRGGEPKAGFGRPPAVNKTHR
ncbi:uncharacterized protein SCHCODRAFT_02591218 [Schizophyllum commune H4-8]|uniref:uncharacterized protein n=1 Tax=Schizophyllum commune (strain H4-8 / FGSC 9210) TaxID=578458 RepID=UPI002160364D|nr:uncharacterized protein SCHCODRAFT_02591218 [Schizophyllum commune H4-8]KAI5887319.1 hypothetical protein SCHCODRAFT_02591218 [Schizophyllum commune H4-8]